MAGMSVNRVPDGMALICQVCGWRPGIGQPMGLVAAHFETEPEHDADDVRLELVVLCPRCDKPMTYLRSEGRKDLFTCDPCRRIRTIRRTA
jgi:hypothetical protein